MKLDALESLRCPNCADSRLTLATTESNAQEVMHGRLKCTTCEAEFPIREGVPRFVGPDNYAGTFGLQWLAHRQTQLDSFTGQPISRTRLFDVTRWPTDMTGDRILEAGSGAGRFTEVLAATGARLWSFDYSRAVEANWLNNGRRPNVHLFQADIFRVPIAPATFDRVICFGVLQHTPDPAKAFRSLVSCVRPGGELAIDVYTASVTARMQWKYLLRPFTTRVDPERLHRFLAATVPSLIRPTAVLRRLGGRVGARLSPIVEYSHLGLAPALNRDWAVLDTFDLYAPKFDLPQSLRTVRTWFADAGLTDVTVSYGPNGVIGRGRKRS